MQIDPKTPAFFIDKTPIYHSFKDGETASYWYRLTPDVNGHNGRDEDITGAFDVRTLNALTAEPCYTSFIDWDAYYNAFLLWVQDTCRDDFKSIEKVLIK